MNQIIAALNGHKQFTVGFLDSRQNHFGAYNKGMLPSHGAADIATRVVEQHQADQNIFAALTDFVSEVQQEAVPGSQVGSEVSAPSHTLRNVVIAFSVVFVLVVLGFFLIARPIRERRLAPPPKAPRVGPHRHRPTRTRCSASPASSPTAQRDAGIGAVVGAFSVGRGCSAGLTSRRAAAGRSARPGSRPPRLWRTARAQDGRSALYMLCDTSTVEVVEALITQVRHTQPKSDDGPRDDETIALLRHLEPGQGTAPRAASELGRRLDAAAVWLTAGRDLLQTHFAVGADGTRQHRSEWAMAATSPPATRALLAEIATMARQIAPRALTWRCRRPLRAGHLLAAQAERCRRAGCGSRHCPG